MSAFCNNEQANACSAETWMTLLNQACSDPSLVLGRQCWEQGLVSLRTVPVSLLLASGSRLQETLSKGKAACCEIHFLVADGSSTDLLSLFSRSPVSALGGCKDIGGGMKRKRCLEHKLKDTIHIWVVFSDLIHCNDYTFIKIQAEVVPCQTKCNRNLRSSC